MHFPFNQSNWNKTFLKWDQYTSPFRPSNQDIKNYFSVFGQSIKKKKILLLGATPEIREPLSKIDSFIVVADFSVEMLTGMLSFIKQKGELRERWIKVDWMELDNFLKNDYFDFILGDLVLRNISPNCQLKFLKKISKLLKNGGTFISRIHLLNENLFNLDSKQIISVSFRQGKNIENKVLEDLITSRLFDKNTDLVSRTINKNSFAIDIRSYLKENTRNSTERLILKNISKKWISPKTWTQRKEKEIKSLLAGNFRIKDIRISKDYKDSNFYPFYILSKKND